MPILGTAMLMLALFSGAAGAAQDALARPGVAEVIEKLRQEGLPVIYSDELVSPQLRVVAEPRSDAPLAMLREILAAHALALQEAEGYFYVVQAQAADAGNTGSLLILVRQADTGQPVEDARVSMLPDRRTVRALSNGAFQVTGLRPGRLAVTVSAPGFGTRRIEVAMTEGSRISRRIELTAARTGFETLTVTASRYDLENAGGATSNYFTPMDIDLIPAHREDPLRAVHQLPGIASTDLSARSFVRGGDRDEVAVLFDGIELLDPFHIRDFQSVFSTFDKHAISGLRVYTGGFPAEYGGRMSGVVAMEPLEPLPGYHGALGLSALNTSVLGHGSSTDDRAQWLFSARRSNLGKLLEHTRLGKPEFNDVYARLTLSSSPDSKFSLSALTASDRVLLVAENDEDEQNFARSNTRNTHVWLRWENEWVGGLHSRITAFRGDVFSERSGLIDDAEKIVGEVRDLRDIRIAGVSQDWRWQTSESVLTRWGVTWQRSEAAYDYLGQAEFAGIYAAYEGVPDQRSIAVRTRPEGTRTAAHLSQRRRLADRWFLEAGLRWDRYGYLPESRNQWNPRGSLLFRASRKLDLRMSLGLYSQADGIHELQVEDGVTRFSRPQRSRQAILGVDYRFNDSLSLRAELYRKDIRALRPRFENRVNNLELLAELEPDRVRVAPDKAVSEGIDLRFAFRPHEGLDGWLRYSLARVTDRIAGTAVPRYWDQRHAAGAGINVDVGAWILSGAIDYHSGWPITEVSVETAAGGTGEESVVARFGAANAGRLGSYLSADFRVSRWFETGRGRLQFFLELSNLQNRFNPCCIDFDYGFDNEGRLVLERSEGGWLPLLPEVGLRWEF